MPNNLLEAMANKEIPPWMVEKYWKAYSLDCPMRAAVRRQFRRHMFPWMIVAGAAGGIILAAALQLKPGDDVRTLLFIVATLSVIASVVMMANMLIMKVRNADFELLCDADQVRMLLNEPGGLFGESCSYDRLKQRFTIILVDVAVELQYSIQKHGESAATEEVRGKFNSIYDKGDKFNLVEKDRNIYHERGKKKLADMHPMLLQHLQPVRVGST